MAATGPGSGVPPGSADGPLAARADVDRVPEVVVVGAATRDVAPDDERGWRVGGSVAYAALATARLGLRTAALLGAEPLVAAAPELDLLRTAGVDLRVVPLVHGPVFENVEVRGGRVQRCHGVADPIDTAIVPPAWGRAPAWLLAPVAGELHEAWAGIPDSAATVGLAWQGLLRRLTAGADVERRRPAAGPLTRRADIVAVGHRDLDPEVPMALLAGMLAPRATLVLTQGERGGMVIPAGSDGVRGARRYPAVRAAAVDSTGAGDVFLAALLATRAQPRLVGGRIAQGMDLLLAAAAAALVTEGSGLAAVPSREAVQRRMAESVRR